MLNKLFERLPLPFDLKMAASFLSRLPTFLRHKIEPAQARQIILQRMRNREQRFLDMAKQRIFGYPQSPYLKLMQYAGIELGDIKVMLRREGLEGTLIELLRAGVYLKVDEFKGRKDAVRGSQTIRTDPVRLRNPESQFHIPVHSSGSRTGSGTPVMIDLAYVADCAVNICLLFHLHSGDDWLKSDWEVPGGGALFRLLKFSRFGKPPVKWFSQLDPSSKELHPRYRYSGLGLHYASLALRSPIPAPEYAPLDDPSPIARWMAATLAKGGIPFLDTFPSSAVRLCLAAHEQGIDLTGSRILISGEPITAARTATIERTGAKLLPRYGSMETGPMGYCCMNRQGPDDLHMVEDLHALIQAGSHGPALGLPAEALFISSLQPSAPFVMLNVSMGDQAELLPGGCGCPVEEYWPHRIRKIRSFEKLTCAGMTFLDTDVVKLLEEVLPGLYGGAPTDYQLLDNEDERGEPQLHLLIHPELGPLDESQVRETFFQALRGGSESAKVMGMTLQGAGVLKIRRQVPLSSGGGKILHLHVAK
jgi:hypothetical protein